MTPGTALKAPSTEDTHEAHDMPPTRSVAWPGCKAWGGKQVLNEAIGVVNWSILHINLSNVLNTGTVPVCDNMSINEKKVVNIITTLLRFNQVHSCAMQ